MNPSAIVSSLFCLGIEFLLVIDQVVDNMIGLKKTTLLICGMIGLFIVIELQFKINQRLDVFPRHSELEIKPEKDAKNVLAWLLQQLDVRWILGQDEEHLNVQDSEDNSTDGNTDRSMVGAGLELKLSLEY